MKVEWIIDDWIKNTHKLEKIAYILINHCVRLKKWELVFIENNDSDAWKFLDMLHKEAIKAWAERVKIWWNTVDVQENIFNYSNLQQQKELLNWLEKIVKESHIYIKLKSWKKLPTNYWKKMVEYQKKLRPIINLYSNSSIKRVLFYYPWKAMAKKIWVSQQDALDITYKACNLDYLQIEKENLKLYKIIKKTDKVRIHGKWTELHFSIKDIPVISAHWRRNMPDWEVFTAPVKHSVNWTIFFDIPTNFFWISFNSIRLIIKKWKIISAKSSNKQKNEALKEMLDSHPQNRYFWEFGIGTNTNIKKNVKLTIFDEKIAGTIHFAIWRCYKKASNWNEEGTIHWDVIKNMRHEWSQMYFDDKLVMENGKFIF